MVPPRQTNTIDFDAAKLQRLGFTGNRNLPLKPASLVELRQQLGLQLQTSLDAERIVSLFFREVQRLVPLDALAFAHPAHDLRLELGERAPHSAGYRLSHEGEYLGELIFRRKLRFADDELAQLESLLACLLFPLRNALLYRTALQSALRDPLTDTGNRIAMDQVLQREVDLARRNLQPLSLLMLDIDHFKQINDSHGHAAGDSVLRRFAALLVDLIRESDYAVRWGGEEFLIVARQADARQAGAMAERIVQRVRDTRFPVDGGQGELGCTCSVGVAAAPFIPGDPESLEWEQVVALADAAVYHAKRRGRDGWVEVAAAPDTRSADLPDLLEGARTSIEASATRGLLTLRTSATTQSA